MDTVGTDILARTVTVRSVVLSPDGPLWNTDRLYLKLLKAFTISGSLPARFAS